MTPIEQAAIALACLSVTLFVALIAVSFLGLPSRTPTCPICGSKNYRIEGTEATYFDESRYDKIFSCGYAVDDEGRPTSLCDSDLHTRTQRNMIREAK